MIAAPRLATVGMKVSRTTFCRSRPSGGMAADVAKRSPDNRSGVIAPDIIFFDGVEPAGRLGRYLGQRAVMVRRSIAVKFSRGRLGGFHGDVAVGVGRVADHQHLTLRLATSLSALPGTVKMAPFAPPRAGLCVPCPWCADARQPESHTRHP